MHLLLPQWHKRLCINNMMLYMMQNLTATLQSTAQVVPHIAQCHVTCSVPFLVQGILKGGLGKALNRLLDVVHAHTHARPLKLVHLPLLHLTATVGREDQLQLARLLHHQVCRSVLVPKSVPASMIASERSTPWSGVDERSMKWS